MKQLFKIDESEKRRILEMHENATRKNYLNEQEPTQPTQRANVPHTIVDNDGRPSTLKTSLPKIQNMQDLAEFNFYKDSPKEVIQSLNDTGVKMYVSKSVMGSEPITLIPTERVKDEQLNYAGQRLSNLLSAIFRFIVYDVCAAEGSNCTGTFTYQQVRKAMDAIKTRREDAAIELGGKIPSYSEAIETMSLLNKTNENVTSESYDGMLKNISFTGFINAAVILLNNDYSSL